MCNAEPAALRTMQTMQVDIGTSIRTGVESRGVFGCTRLTNLTHFDLIKGQVVDIAHKDYLGNGKRFSELHMADVGKGWYIGQPSNKKN